MPERTRAAPSEDLDALLQGLNEPQREAVTYGDGPLLILAGAGSGKTRVLTHRIAYLVRTGRARAGEILAITFTNKAAQEMRERVEVLVGRRTRAMWVMTFHSACTRILRAEGDKLGYTRGFTIYDEADSLRLIKQCMDELDIDPKRFTPRAIKRQISDAKNSLLDASGYRETISSFFEQTAADVYELYEQRIHSMNAMDFDDLLFRCVTLFELFDEVRRRYADSFRHVLVDEYQDTNFAQGALLRLLCQDHRNVTAVGDDDQAIYRFRGASRKNLLEFQREYEDCKLVKLERNYRSGQRILDASGAVVAGGGERIEKRLRGSKGGEVSFWRCRSERAQAQAVAAECERLVSQEGVPPEEICVLVRTVRDEGQTIAAALEERAVPFRLTGAAAYFQRTEVRDVLAWLRLLADPADSGAVVRALTRPPIELRSVDIARLTQHARRRRLDMVAGVIAACDGPQLSPEGRDRAQAFLRLYRSASTAFAEMRPDTFVHRLIERIGLRRQQVFAAQADTVERLVNIAKLSELASAYMRRQPDSTPRDFVRYVAAMAEAGLREEEAAPEDLPPAVQVMAMHSAKGREFDHVLVAGLNANRMPGTHRGSGDGIPRELLKEELPDDGRAAYEDEMRRMLHVAMTRARKGLVLAWPEGGERSRPSPFYEEARAALRAGEELHEEELFGPAEGLHSTFRMLRDELLDSVSSVGGRLSEMRLDTYIDISQSVVRYLELLKVAALIEREREGQSLAQALPEVNELLLQEVTPDQRELFLSSALDDYLADTERDARRRAEVISRGGDQSLETFIPRRGDGLMLSASDIETYRLCPLKYKFARVFRIPQEPTINQRFGILIHQVLERFHAEHVRAEALSQAAESGGPPASVAGTLDRLLSLFEAGWRRTGFGSSDDELQYRDRAVAALARYHEHHVRSESRPVWLERSFAFAIGSHQLRGRVDRVDQLPGGGYELIDYKTGERRTGTGDDVQLALYRLGAREAWQLQTELGSYWYVLEDERVPVPAAPDDAERVERTVLEVAAGIEGQDFEPRPSYEICSWCDYRLICPASEA